MKKIISFLIVVFLFVAFISLNTVVVKADKQSGDFYYVISGGTATITGFYQYSGKKEVNIPSTIDGYTVTKINKGAFQYHYGIEKIIIPDTVVTIGAEAFMSCSKLETVNVLGSLDKIDERTFYECFALKIVTIAGDVKKIEKRAFYRCYKLEKIEFLKGLEYIDEYAFKECGITDIFIPNGIVQIANNAFDRSGLKNIWYGGNEKEKIDFVWSSDGTLSNATWHYNSCAIGVPHSYDNDCDSDCNGCGLVRTVPDHKYDNDCDTNCNVCNTARITEHKYDNTCDTTCNICSAIRNIEHKYDNTCDIECNVCKGTRQITHSYGAWQTTKKPSCTSSGTQTRECAVCHNIDTQNIGALGHDYETLWTVDKEATCTEAGSKSHHCTKCDAKKDVTTIKPSGHSWGNWVVTKAATISAEGESERKCKNCTLTEKQTIAKLAEDGHTHKFGEWAVKKTATCLEAGYAERKCSICKEAEKKDIVATGHQVGEWEETAPTCTAEGYRERKCVVCGNVEKNIIKATGHNFENADGKCKNCGVTQEKQTVSETASQTQTSGNSANAKTEKGWIVWFVLGGLLIIGLGTAAIILAIKNKKKK